MSFRLRDCLVVTREVSAALERRDRCPCDKRVFATKAEALATRRRTEHRFGATPMRTYACPFGPGYHLGHRRGVA